MRPSRHRLKPALKKLMIQGNRGGESRSPQNVLLGFGEENRERGRYRRKAGGGRAGGRGEGKREKGGRMQGGRMEKGRKGKRGRKGVSEKEGGRERGMEGARVSEESRTWNKVKRERENEPKFTGSRPAKRSKPTTAKMDITMARMQRAFATACKIISR